MAKTLDCLTVTIMVTLDGTWEHGLLNNRSDISRDCSGPNIPHQDTNIGFNSTNICRRITCIRVPMRHCPPREYMRWS